MMQQQPTPQPVQTVVQPQQVAATTTNVILNPQQIHVVRTNQQSPGCHSKLLTADHFFETNAFDNKTQSPSPSSSNNINNNKIINNNENNNHNSNNLLTLANVHKEFSCSNIGDENNISSSSPVNSTSVINISNNNATMIVEKSESDEKSLSNESGTSKAECKNSSISVASNIANTFMNLSSKSVPNSPSPAPKSVNLIVTQQPLSQQLMKTLSFTTSRGIFVPNVIATNIAPQFTVHQYGLHGNSSGPAPNVTVNPNGNFNTNSGAIRPGTPNHFRLLLQQTPNINFNIVNQNASSNAAAHPSPILEASLQTITKEATLQATKLKTIYPNQVQRAAIKNEESDNSNQEAPSSSNDQHIRVLTPSEIMKTLPSLSSHDSTHVFSDKQSTHDNETIRKPLETSGSVASTSQNISNSSSITISSNSVTSSPLTITTTTTTITSECNNTFSSHFTAVTKATAMSSTPPNNNAQIIMVRGYINV
jgi:hypothetical protein